MPMPRLQTVLLGLLIAGGMALLVSMLIVTDEEAIEAWAEAAEGAFADRDAARLTELLAPDFEFGSQDRAATIDQVLRAKRRYGVTSVDIGLSEIKVDGDSATANAQIRSTSMGRIWQANTHLRFARFDEGWALAHADDLDYAGQ